VTKRVAQRLDEVETLQLAAKLHGFKGPPWATHSTYVLHYVKFEVFTANTMKNDVFWDVTPCVSLKKRRFGGT
jgi:hypothetical protein